MTTDFSSKSDFCTLLVLRLHALFAGFVFIICDVCVLHSQLDTQESDLLHCSHHEENLS